MTSDEIRDAFLRYFERQRHARVPSSSLVPGNDPTLLFTNAGMVQFKDVFLGLEERSYRRATSSQRCMRAGGKHNDLDNVGRTARHHTFFEMLGNFSFGDYFKEDAIRFAWEFITGELKIDPASLWVTVFRDDDEAVALWREIAGLPADRIVRLGEKDNWWAMAETGPQGPSSEIHIDRGEGRSCGPDCGIGRCDCDRWLEFWNLVFMQFNRDADGVLSPLPRPSIDTGMGLERIASIVQNVETNWDTDLFTPILARIEQLAGKPYHPGEAGFPFRVIADHARACAFLIADGVLPSNEWRGYVLRRILRRAVRFGRKLGLDRPFFADVADAVIDRMAAAYPELVKRREFVRLVIEREEERFGQTLATGLQLLDTLMVSARSRGERTIPGEDTFRLYDTFGFPRELTDEVALENGFVVDDAGFQAALARQRDQSKATARFRGAGVERFNGLDLPELRFVGYDRQSHQSPVVAILLDGQPVDAAAEGQQVELLVRETPFYPEGGGQVGDTGTVRAESGRATVLDTQRPAPEIIVHRARVDEGFLSVGDPVRLEIDGERRGNVMRNHTATHLLHAALQSVLGSHARQAGSLVAPDRLRFDFTHLAPVSPLELREVQRQVSQRVYEDLPVTPALASYDDAIAAGAMALFGEKYGDTVRTICIRRPAVEELEVGLPCASLELCGGTHCSHTGEIGPFVIVSEGSVGSGIRRIEALTGPAAEALIAQRNETIDNLARLLKVQPSEIEGRVATLQAELVAERRRSEQLEREIARREIEALAQRAEQVDGVTVLTVRVQAARPEALREMTDWLRDRLKSAIIVLGAPIGDRPQFIAAVTPDLVAKGYHAGEIVRRAAAVAGGGGGGRPELAQAGGKDPSKIDEALRAARQAVEKV
ncbi:MAG: alanine--tRNA ligase [Dehalococcoidia bacterium]